MRLRDKAAAFFTAAMIASSAIPTVYAGAEGDSTADPASTTAPVTTAPATTAEEDTTPYLGAGAFAGGYTSLSPRVKKGDTIGISVETYIPVENYDFGVTADDFFTSDIFAVPVSNAFFQVPQRSEWYSSKRMAGSFLCVTSNFNGIKYIGGGNTFSYNLCYLSGKQSVNAQISIVIAECDMSEEAKEEEILAVFAYTGGGSTTVKAGGTATVNVKLNKMNNGKFSQIAASLRSPDGSVVVEETGLKTSSSSSPSFSFKISAPKTTSAGVYNLTLDTAVYEKNNSTPVNASYTIPVTVTSDVVSSGLEISSYKVSKEPLKSGDKFKLTLTLKNSCHTDLQDIKVSLTGLDSAKFVLDGGFSAQSVSIKSGKTATVTFGLVACSGMAAVRENIPVTAEYRLNPADAASAQALSTSVVVQCVPDDEKQDAGKYDITMTDYSVDNNAVKNKTRFTLQFTLKNISKKNISNARVSLTELNGTKFAIDNGLSYAVFDIKAGESKSFTFPLVGCSGISSIREVIPIEITFGQQTSTVYATVTCDPPADKDPDKETVFAPAIIIESYDFGGDHVVGGTAFPLSLVIKNTGSSAVIENLKVTIAGGPGNGNNGVAFSPANSSNSFFIERLTPKGTTDINIDLLPRADANPDSYPVIATFEYEYIANDKRSKAETITETITIPLQQEDRFTINEPDFPANPGMGMMSSVSVSLVNKGKSSVYNVSADLEGEGFSKSTTGAYYIGNVDSGAEEYYDVQITPYMEGPIDAEIVVTYEDSNGNQKEQRVPIHMDVIAIDYGGMYGGDMGYFDDGMGDMGEMPVEEGGSLWIWIAVGGGLAVIAAIIVIVAIVKKKRRQKELEMDDEDI